MINEARTLLINLEGPREENPAYPGDVYIPEYTPPNLSTALQSVRNLLFGSSYDYDGLLYRVAQYMAILHSTDYAAYLTAYDSRITYDPGRSDIMDSVKYGSFVETTSSQALSVFVQPAPAAINGRVNTIWRIQGSTGNKLSVNNLTDGLTSNQQAYAGVTLLLTGSDMTFEIGGTAIVPGDTWRVTHKVKPTPDLGTILSTAAGMSAKLTETLFGNVAEGVLVEPYLTFYNLFTRHYALTYRFSGLLLALIARTREVHSGNDSGT